MNPQRSDARLTALMAVLFSFAHITLAAPPPNDLRAQAAPLVIQVTTRNAHDDFSAPLNFSGTTMTTSTALASLEPGEPGAFGNQASVWLRFTPPQAGWFSASCSYFCVLDVWHGAVLAALTGGIVGVRPSSSSSSFNIQPATFLTFHAGAGEAVYLRVLTSQDTNVTITVKPAVAGDHFADALDAGAATNFTHTNPLGEMTMEAGEPGALRESFWVRWTAPASGVFRARASTPAWVRSSGEAGSDPKVRAFQGASIAGLTPGPTVPLGIVNQPCLLRAVAGQTYFFQAGITPSQFFSFFGSSSSAGGIITMAAKALTR